MTNDRSSFDQASTSVLTDDREQILTDVGKVFEMLRTAKALVTMLLEAGNDLEEVKAVLMDHALRIDWPSDAGRSQVAFVLATAVCEGYQQHVLSDSGGNQDDI